MKAIITIQSTAKALSAEKLLQKAGLAVGMMSLPTELGTECGFCLRVPFDDLPKALELLDAANLTWHKAFTKSGDQTKSWRIAADSAPKL
jgi:hypothetical protein